MKIKTKNIKNDVMFTVNLTLHKELTLKKPKREIRLEWWKWKKLHMERHYEGSHILFLESRAQLCLYRFVLTFSPFIVDLTFGKILIYMRRVTASLAQAQKILFLQMPRWVPCKKYRANDMEETCNHPNL